jgi:microcystin-dependent protein
MATIAITKGYNDPSGFVSGEVVTPAKLNSAQSPAAAITFATADDTDDSTLEVSGGKFRVKDGGITSAKLLAAVANALMPVGAVQAFARSTAPTGWLAANGNTIGSASSGATNASADYSALFAVLWGNWTNTALPILTSGGSASTRGADAATDFAANKRLPLPNLNGIFIRGAGSAQTIGGNSYSGTFAQKQADELKAHTHTVNGRSGIGYTIGGVSANGANISGTETTSSTGGTETQPANIALLYCIKF